MNKLIYKLMPVNPMKPRAIIPAVIIEIDVPLNAKGISLCSSFSRIPAKRTRTKPKPMPVDRPYNRTSNKLYCVSLDMIKARPNTAQFVVIRGR